MITKDFSSTYTLPENQTVFCHYTKKIISCQQGFSGIHNQNHLNDLLHYQKNKAETRVPEIGFWGTRNQPKIGLNGKLNNKDLKHFLHIFIFSKFYSAFGEVDSTVKNHQIWQKFGKQ